jgi:hypothetical protein
MKFKKSILWISCIILLSQCKEKESQPGSLSIIPYPVTLTKGDGSFTVNKDTRIVSTDSISRSAATFIAEILSASSQFNLTITNEISESNVIEFAVAPVLTSEAYQMNITGKSIIIKCFHQILRKEISQ